MAKTVVMPQMGYDMDAGTLLRWLKQEGDAVERGEAIAEIETDKVNLEIEAFDGGIVRKHLINEGETVPVGDPIAIIGTADEAIEVPASSSASKPAAKAEAAPAAQAAPAEPRPAEANHAEPVPAHVDAAPSVADQVFSRAPGERVRASPLVRRLAAEHEIDLSGVRGTGPGGRIVKEDVLPLIGRPRAVPQAPAEPVAPAAPVAAEMPAAAPVFANGHQAGEPSELRNLSNMRKTIARRMTESFQAPHFYVSISVDVARAMELRKQINEQVEGPQKISVNDLIVRAAAVGLRKFPNINASFAGEQVRLYSHINVGIAVALDSGLITPVVKDADRIPLTELASRSKNLIERARNGGLTPDDYQGGTFTVSNLGMYGVDQFTAVINPPQAAILAIGQIQKTPVWDGDQFVGRDLMQVTMSADHRVTDGAEVARYLSEFKRLFEKPMLLLVS